jgi:hypothetical protein
VTSGAAIAFSDDGGGEVDLMQEHQATFSLTED